MNLPIGYEEIYNKIRKWYIDGKLPLKGIEYLDDNEMDDLDAVIIEVFGYSNFFLPLDTYGRIGALVRDINKKKINIDFLFGDNGLTLFKMLLIRKNLLD